MDRATEPAAVGRNNVVIVALHVPRSCVQFSIGAPRRGRRYLPKIADKLIDCRLWLAASPDNGGGGGGQLIVAAAAAAADSSDHDRGILWLSSAAVVINCTDVRLKQYAMTMITR